MHLMIEREAVAQHLKAAGDLLTPNGDLKTKADAALYAGMCYSKRLPQLAVGKGRVPSLLPSSTSSPPTCATSNAPRGARPSAAWADWQVKLERSSHSSVASSTSAPSCSRSLQPSATRSGASTVSARPRRRGRCGARPGRCRDTQNMERRPTRPVVAKRSRALPFPASCERLGAIALTRSNEDRMSCGSRPAARLDWRGADRRQAVDRTEPDCRPDLDLGAWRGRPRRCWRLHPRPRG